MVRESGDIIEGGAPPAADRPSPELDKARGGGPVLNLTAGEPSSARTPAPLRPRPPQARSGSTRRTIFPVLALAAIISCPERASARGRTAWITGFSRPCSARCVEGACLGRVVVLLDDAQGNQGIGLNLGAADGTRNPKRLLAPAAGLVPRSRMDERLGHGGGHPGP